MDCRLRGFVLLVFINLNLHRRFHVRYEITKRILLTLSYLKLQIITVHCLANFSYQIRMNVHTQTITYSYQLSVNSRRQANSPRNF